MSGGEIVSSTLFVNSPNVFIGLALNSAVTGDEFSIQIPDAIGSPNLTFLVNGTTGSSPFAAASVAAVPLPATGWMLLAGISGVAAMSRRKKRK
ncbi:MAG: VPLPA-CTERM sorting domain-containing protein [Pseudomonadota bacterium]